MQEIYKKRFKRRLITLLSLITLLIILIILRQFTPVCEWWSRTIGRGLFYIIGPINKYLPFSITELFIIFVIIAVATWLFFTIRHLHRFHLKASSKWWFMIANSILSLLIVYVGTAGMAYNRDPVDIPQYEGDPIEDEQYYYDMANYFLADFNNAAKELTFQENGEIIRPYTIQELNNIMNEEYKKLDSGYFTKFTTNGKPMYLLSWLYREFQITGFSFAPLGEASINILATNAELPFTLAHEIAHSKGVMKEEDANLVAAYICINSDNAYLKYSGYLRCFNSAIPFIRASNVNGAYAEYIKSISPNITKNKEYIYSYWDSHNLLENISEFFNNLYLEIFGNETTQSYVDTTETKVIVTPGGQKIYKIEWYSPYQKMLIAKYQKSVAK